MVEGMKLSCRSWRWNFLTILLGIIQNLTTFFASEISQLLECLMNILKSQTITQIWEKWPINHKSTHFDLINGAVPRRRLNSSWHWGLSLQQNAMKYGFVITIKELPKTIPTLWETTQAFMKQNEKLIPRNNLLQFVTDRDGGYNLCHFWSNFEIGDLSFFRSKNYQAYFDFLDRYKTAT